MTILTYPRRPAVPVPRRLGVRQAWAACRPNVARLVVELAADVIHASGDAERRAWGLTVERLPWGGRRVFDPRVPAWCDLYRARALGERLDATDAAMATGVGNCLARLPEYPDPVTRTSVLEAFSPAAEGTSEPRSGPGSSGGTSIAPGPLSAADAPAQAARVAALAGELADAADRVTTALDQAEAAARRGATRRADALAELRTRLEGFGERSA